MMGKNIDVLLKKYYFDKVNYVSVYDNWVSFLKRYILKNNLVLDFGCGPKNKYTKLLASISDNVIGLDVDNIVLENSYLKKAYVYDGKEFPFPQNHFDVVVAHSVLEHIENPNGLLKEIHRILKPGGKFLYRTPNWYNYVVALGSIIPDRLKEGVNNCATGNNSYKQRDFYPTFYRFNKSRTCKSLLVKNGFEIIEFSMIEGAPFYHAGVNVLFRIMMAYERIVNYIELFFNLRTYIQCACIKKDIDT